jgi:hypothetical protein
VNSIGGFLGVTVAIAAWIALSNHCAFGAIADATKTQLAQTGCPFHAQPAKKKAPSAQQCCKTLRAVVAKLAKTWTRDDSKFSGVDLCSEQLIVVAASHSALPLLLDTGPPGKTSFIESIGSVRSHAPPLSV